MLTCPALMKQQWMSGAWRQRLCLIAGVLMAAAWPAGCSAETSSQAGTRPELKRAMPGYEWNFPRDHGAHNNYATEWWYYTGHMDLADGRTFGFELTFFRSRMDGAEGAKSPNSAFNPTQMYWAHFALSDLDAEAFYFDEKLNRGGVGVAGAREDTMHAWNGKWSTELLGDVHHLRADLTTPDGKPLAMRLALMPKKGPILHGDKGYSQKSDELGNASMYYSFTRMEIQGTFYEDDKPIPATGSAWMDQEFGTSQLTEDQIGWDWFSLQFKDGTELMVYGLRMKDGSFHPMSGGTFVAADSSATKLKREDFIIESHDTWESPHTGGVYPQNWTLTIKPLDMKVDVTADMPDQELRTRLAGEIDYWEGSVKASGTRGGQDIAGRGYVELVGYSREFDNSL